MPTCPVLLMHVYPCLLMLRIHALACVSSLPTTRYPNNQQQELFFRHYMAEDAAMQQQQQQSRPKRGPFAWLQRLRRHKHSCQQQPPSAPQKHEQQQQLHRLGSMEVPSGTSGSSSSSLPPLAPATLEELSASANVWALSSHLYWGIWAIIQVRCLQVAAVPVTLSSFVIELRDGRTCVRCWCLCTHSASLHIIEAQPDVDVMCCRVVVVWANMPLACHFQVCVRDA